MSEAQLSVVQAPHHTVMTYTTSTRTTSETCTENPKEAAAEQIERDPKNCRKIPLGQLLLLLTPNHSPTAYCTAKHGFCRLAIGSTATEKMRHCSTWSSAG